ncbi:hypothetical protein AAFF_G00227240 [Aldrovandia affinis]|uniref:Uncharacterized protein n=1 Tax=Aldrovandia affinis TaxID=143900 RepID=A0AAD7X1P4_9TELE|nr:hypothetical protein AAFF_G00227240 [Aldrovandia affinis]
MVDRQGSGVVGWIVQGLGKVVPHIDGPKDGPEVEEITEIAEVHRDSECKREARAPVYEAKELPDAEPLPHIPVVEVVSEVEVCDEDSRFPPRVIGWLKQGLEKMVPQPPESAVLINTETPAKKEVPAPQKVASPPPEPPKPEEGEPKAQNVVGWIFQGLGRIIPQPSTKSKEDGECATTMQNGGTKMRAP